MQDELGSIFLICMGLILLSSYLLFAIYITRHGDYYKIRRWKAAIWISLISAFLFAGLVIITIEGYIVLNSPLSQNPILLLETIANTYIQSFKTIIGLLFASSFCLVPYLFMVTLGVYYKLKWWFGSDDLLYKIWKDPKRPIRSPLQWL